jgi:molybdate transport repressor ModE-like protein
MNIDNLRMFIQIVSLGSISKAAGQMHISQSALSQQVKALENLLNCSLLERSNKGVRTTSAGEIVYKYALQITSTYDQMLKDINLLAGETRTLNILAAPVICSYALPCTLYHIKKNYPTFVLEMTALPSHQVEEQLVAGRGDIGFTVGPPQLSGLEGKKVISDRIHLVAGKNETIPSHITADRLASYPLLMLPKNYRSRTLLEDYLTQTGIDVANLKILYHLDSIESLKLSAINGYGLAFLPYMAIM